MAAKGQKKARADRSERMERSGRVSPSIEVSTRSRVSKAAGDIDSEKMRVEQRGGASASSSSAAKPRRASAAATSRRGQSSQSPQSSRSPNAGGKRASSRRPSPASSTPTPQPADSRIIGNMHKKWQSLQPHHQQRVYSFILLALAVLLFGGLTFWHASSILGHIGDFFFLFLGWGAYPLSIGLILLAFAYLIEGLRNIRFVRWSPVIGLLAMLLLALTDSALFTTGSGGVIGSWLSRPLLGWPVQVQFLLVNGLLVLAAIVTFRIRTTHVRGVLSMLRKVFADPARKTGEASAARPSPYLGQRPQYSRYTGIQPDAR
ncbi:MAG TPA: hypothetical protein VKT25_12050, partial [Ktedonobacteraceae bacterium]|nr:hypothetical protein [Ktedonobacteraceae bacterium]